MKKFLIILILIIVMGLAVSCHNPQPTTEDKYFSVTFSGEFFDDFVMTVKKDDTAIKPQNPLADNYEFLYWAMADGKEYDFDLPIEDNVELHAVWRKVETGEVEVKYFTVRFFGVNGEQIGPAQQVAEGKSAVSPPISVSDFFVFDRWDKNFNAVTENMDVFALEKYDPLDADFFTYKLNSDRTYIITGIKADAPIPKMAGGYIKLALPTEYNGVAITGIADGTERTGAFSYKKIFSVYVPGQYRRIGAYAFYGNPYLTNVVFNEGLKEIGKGAFMATLGEGYSHKGDFIGSGADAYVSALTKISFPSSLETIGPYAFNHIGCEFESNDRYVMNEVEVNFGKQSNLIRIGEHAFEGAMIKKLSLPSTNIPLTIDSYAFAADTYLNWVYTGSYGYPKSITKKLYLPDTIRTVGEYAFYGLGNNSTYSNGVCTTVAQNVEFISSKLNVEHIDDYAFYGAKLTGSVYIISKEIGDYAFYGQMLSSISLSLVEKIGDYAFGRVDGTTNLTLNFGYDLKTIGKGAFINNAGLAKITLPETITSIGAYAFSGCTTLNGTITFPQKLSGVGDSAFAHCAFSRLDIKGSVSLGKKCFESSGLKEVVGTIASVDEKTFYNCKSLTSVVLPNSVYKLPTALFANCEILKSITLPRSLSVIGDHAFDGCVSLSQIKFPVDFKSVGVGAFQGCLSLSKVEFEGDSVKEIGDDAFALCPALNNIRLPDSVSTIGNYAFRGCGIESFKTPASLKYLGWRVFCKEEYYSTRFGFSQTPTGGSTKVCLPVLDKIIVSRATEKIEFSPQGTFDGALIAGFEVEEGNRFYSARSGILYNKNEDGDLQLIMYIRNENNKKIVLCDGLKEIGEGAFWDNPYIESVIFPSSLKIIGDYAFYNCANLKSLNFPSSVVSIGKYAFAGSEDNLSKIAELNFGDSSIEVISEGAFCYNCALKDVKLPRSLVNLGAKAFYSNSALRNIDLSEASSLISIGDMAFSGDENSPKIKSLDFSGCSSLVGTGRNAFANCELLMDIDFAEIERIDTGSFNGCIGLTEINIGSKVVEIGSGAFRNCSSLTEINIPKNNNLKRIMSYAFAGTVSQKAAYLYVNLFEATSLESIGNFAFAYGDVQSVVLPDCPFVLGDEVFSSCSNLTEVYFGLVTEIGENVFRYCLSLEEIYLPYSLRLLSRDAFRGLNLKKVHIGSPENGNSLAEIEENAFFDCKMLTIVDIYGSNAPYLLGDRNNFSFHCFDVNGQIAIIKGLKIFVDEGAVNMFIGYGLGWDEYKSIFYIRDSLSALKEAKIIGGHYAFCL